MSGVAPHCHPVRTFATLRHVTGASSPPLLLQIYTTQSLYSHLCSRGMGRAIMHFTAAIYHHSFQKLHISRVVSKILTTFVATSRKTGQDIWENIAFRYCHLLQETSTIQPEQTYKTIGTKCLRYAWVVFILYVSMWKYFWSVITNSRSLFVVVREGRCQGKDLLNFMCNL